jgi:chromatin segregation and condensation protein Rec8/ScpA/Scc1 (kleisin family)
LLLVAALMEIKARELLSQEAELDIEDPASVDAQADMLARLIQYATFKQAATWLGDHAPQHRWWRVASRPVRRAPRAYDGPIMDPQRLTAAMQVLLAQPDVDVRHLVGRHASVGEMTARLLGRLRDRRVVNFDEAVEGLNRLDQAVAFIAALELCKNGRVELRQDDRFGPITVSRCEVATQPTQDAGENERVGEQAGTTGREFQSA